MSTLDPAVNPVPMIVIVVPPVVGPLLGDREVMVGLPTGRRNDEGGTVNLTLWILAGGLAVAYTAGGLGMVLLPKERFRAAGPSQHWVDDFTGGHVKAIGAIKLVGCLGLVLPAALDVAPVLTPLAACGLMLLMSGAATTRFRRSEWRFLVGDLFLLGLFAFLAWERFDLHPF